METENLKHTPGPWIITDFSHKPKLLFDFIISAIGGNTICKIQKNIHVGPNKEERAANTKLIAAAPELLEALIEITKWSAHFPEAMNEVLLKSRSAINKATE